jgi:hypothetical protein
MASPNVENLPATVFRTLSGGVEPDEYELDSKSWPTWRRYRAAFNSYTTFCEETGAQPFPATVPTIRTYFRHVVEGGGACNDDAEPFVWTKSKVYQRRVKGRRLSEL